MDDDELRVELADGQGRALASNALMAALVATLVSNGKISRAEAATLTGRAQAVIDKDTEIADYARVIANSCLKGFSTSWVKLVTRN